MKKENRNYDCDLGKFIHGIVEESEYSHEEWAELLNVSTKSISSYCSGERKPSQRRLLQILKFAGGIKAEDIPF